MNIRAKHIWRRQWRTFATITITFFTPLLLLAQMQTSGPYSVSGTVINAATGSPLAHASVSLLLSKDRAQAASVTADDRGAFTFHHLPADRYILSASHRGFLTQDYDGHDGFTTGLVTGEGMACCANLQMKLTPGGVISGVVTDDSGDPVERGRITLYRESNRTGEERMQRARVQSLDESGAYELSGLEPGSYFLTVSATPWYAQRGRGMQIGSRVQAGGNEEHHSPLDVVYATTFYPDTTDENEATPIPIKGGEHLTINFNLHPVQAVHLRVQLLTPATERQQGPISMPAIEQKVFGVSDSIGGPFFFNRFSDTGPSEAEISVPPGQYVIQTRVERDGTPGKEITVNVTNDQTVNPNTGTQLAEVTGKFALASGEVLPENTFVNLQQVGGQGVGGERVNKDGTFTIRNVASGAYHINFFAAGKRLRVTKLVANGAQIAHRQITVGSEPVTLAGLLYPDTEVSVSGFVKKDGKAVPGAMVVLIPENPADYRDYFRRDQSDWDGQFALNNVEPGKYTVIAIQDGWTLDWAEPEVIRHYLSQGQSVSITERSPQTVKLGDAVEMQAK